MKSRSENKDPVITERISDLNNYFIVMNWIEKHLDDLETKLSLVKHLLYQPVNDDNFNLAINAIHFIIEKIPLMVTYIEPCIIVRARPNYGRIFSEEQDISYNFKNSHLIKAGRFNRPLEPLFYGSLRVDNTNTDPVLTCAVESCKELLDENNPPPLQDLTVGIWQVQKPFPVMNLCFDEKHLTYNKILKIATEKYLEETENNFSVSAYDFIKQFMRFFSTLSRSVDKLQNHNYILEAMITAVRYYYGSTLSTAVLGIIYPSAMSEAAGLNIVMTPEAVDDCLHLEKVGMYRFYLVKGTKQYISYPCSDLVPVIDKKFTITGFKPSASSNS